MHECLECGRLCWCDMDDLMLPAPRNCWHVCEDEDGFDDGDAIEDEED